jgi:hypothetical protein
MIMAYADKARAESQMSLAGKTSEGAEKPNVDQPIEIPETRKLLLVNNWYQNLLVKITDPAGRSCEYQVRGNFSGEFNWDGDFIPWSYTINVMGSRINRFSCKTVGPMTKYQNNGKGYPLMVTIDPNN